MRLAEILKAAGEPTRLRLLNLLRQGDICVCDLQAVLAIPQHTVSRHLAALRHAGLVTDERNGQRVIYSLTPAASAPVRGLHELLTKSARQESVLRDDLARLKRLLRKGECSLIAATPRQRKTER
jgi:ArsR family transcriptional regulator